MVYSNQFVVCVLVDGKPQKERKDGIVLVPYGIEYSLRFRNKHNRRAVVKFTIDDENVGGPGYIIPAHSAVDIHRHHDKDVKFKFVSLDSPEAVDYGKNDNSDGSKGVIEAKFFLENEVKAQPRYEEHHHHHHYPPAPTPSPWPNPWYNPHPPIWMSSPRTYGDSSLGNTSYNACSSYGDTTCSAGGQSVLHSRETLRKNIERIETQQFGEGCTIEGGTSGQTFTEQWINHESDFVALKLILRGVEGPIKVISEEYCTGCGAKRSRKSDRFCGACGHRI